MTVAAVHAARRGADGILQIRVSITPAATGDSAIRMGLIRLHPIKGQPDLVPNSITLLRVMPVTAEAPLADIVSSNERRSLLVRELALDLVQQFAVPRLCSL